MKAFAKNIQILISFILIVTCLSSCFLSGGDGSSVGDEHNGENGDKVLLVSIDGMRPDALLSSDYADRLREISTYSTTATTVYPSYTLPCHMSMQHGVYPESHGVFTNTYTPSLQLVDGIAETA